VCGVELSERTARDVRARVGLVFQDPDDQLFMTTVRDDVAFGPLNQRRPREDVDRAVRDALDAVGLSAEAGKPGHHLSFGQRKRAALATVLSMRPDVYVLDEPTANLDPRAKRRMMELLEGIEATLVVATHDMDLAWRLCARAVILDGGAVAADGPAAELMADRMLLEAHGLEQPAALRRGSPK
jgi:cobalt/nickel transport system ATP-binding protein